MQDFRHDRAARIASDRSRMVRRALVKGGYLTTSETPGDPKALQELLTHVLADLLHLLAESGGPIDRARLDQLTLQAFTYFDKERARV